MQSWKRMIVIGASAGVGFAVVVCLILGLVTWYRSRPKPWNARAIRAVFYKIGTEGKDRTLVFDYLLENATDRDFRILNGSDIEIDARLEKQRALYGTTLGTNRLNIDLPLSLPARQRKWVEIHFGYSPHYTDACIDELSRPVPSPKGEGVYRYSQSGSYGIRSLASVVKKKFPSCSSAEDNRLVALLVRMYPTYWQSLRPGAQAGILNAAYPDQKVLVTFVRKQLTNLGGFVIYEKTNHYEIDFPKGW